MADGQLARAVGVAGAVLMGLGSILGTGIFISVGIAAGIAGPSVVIGIGIAAVVAILNGLSSAQLAASHPVSGGTYEYAYKYLNAPLGFVAGWTFLLAKSASAATAALGFARYVAGDDRATTVALAVAVVGVLAMVVAGGISRSNRTNAVIVCATLVGLAAFVVAGAGSIEARNFAGIAEVDVHSLLHATALSFVAFTGYGRIATLGEEVRDPARTIPRAIVIPLVATALLYISVVGVAIGNVGAARFATAPAPLEVLAPTRTLVAIAAVTAMAGVLLNLLLGLSRVLLAMGRRGDMPPALARLDARKSPRVAVIVTGVAIAGLALVGSVQTTWSFSAFTVLVYYAITNLAALRLPAEHRRFPRAVPALGLASCLGLAFWVDPVIWLVGLGVIAGGLAWHLV
ncbi:MAG TPA: APC family permease, partial [Kofleriaceae bacterium]|nr:APC family permease [Kofleriaceae bacterium]